MQIICQLSFPYFIGCIVSKSTQTKRVSPPSPSRGDAGAGMVWRACYKILASSKSGLLLLGDFGFSHLHGPRT